MKLLEGMLILATEVWPKRLKRGEAIFAVPVNFQSPKTMAIEPLKARCGCAPRAWAWLCVTLPLAVAHQNHPEQSPLARMLAAEYGPAEGARGNTVSFYVADKPSWFLFYSIYGYI